MQHEEHWLDVNVEEMWKEIAESERRLHRKNLRYLALIKRIKGRAFHRHLKGLVKETAENGDTSWTELSFVRKPAGNAQESDFPRIGTEWVDQWSTGPEGDCFAGNIYVQIKKALWLKIPYSC